MLIGEAFLLSTEKDFWRRRTLFLYEGEATARAKSSTLEIIRDLGISRWREERYMTNRSGEMGDP